MVNVFVCHRSGDVSPAERLAGEIRAAGHQVWLYEWTVDVGDSVIGAMNEGLEAAAYLVLCYSAEPGGVHTPWMRREWMSTLARQLEGYSVRILPVILCGGTPPAILADIKYADLVADWSKGVSEVLRAIR